MPSHRHVLLFYLVWALTNTDRLIQACKHSGYHFHPLLLLLIVVVDAQLFCFEMVLTSWWRWRCENKSLSGSIHAHVMKSRGAHSGCHGFGSQAWAKIVLVVLLLCLWFQFPNTSKMRLHSVDSDSWQDAINICSLRACVWWYPTQTHGWLLQKSKWLSVVNLFLYDKIAFYSLQFQNTWSLRFVVCQTSLSLIKSIEKYTNVYNTMFVKISYNLN